MSGRMPRPPLHRAGPAAALLVVLAAAWHAPAARAAAVGLSSDGSTLIYRAAPGEANRLQITFFQDFTNPTTWVVQDAGASITAYAGCAVDPSATFVSCGSAHPFNVTAMDVDLGDLGDSARIDDNRIISRTRIAGGPGNDDLLGVAHAQNTILGEDGNDRVNADFISALPGTFAGDTISGGPGDDVLVGGGGPDTISGDAGNDEIDDTYSDGVLSGGPGDDAIHGGGGNDQINGDEGTDSVTGGAGDDRIAGGAGTDTLAGQDGNDSIEARDGEVDRVACGTGGDTVQADTIDVIGADEASNCEQVFRTAAAAPPAGATAPAVSLTAGAGQRVLRTRAVRISARCARVCGLIGHGTIRVAGRRRALGLGSDVLTLRAGERGTLRLAVGRSARSVLRRALARGRRAVATVRVRVTTAGATSTRTVRVRLLR